MGIAVTAGDDDFAALLEFATLRLESGEPCDAASLRAARPDLASAAEAVAIAVVRLRALESSLRSGPRSDAAAPSLAAGASTASWTILAFVARGGSGEVYRARDREGRDVAVKILRPEAATTAGRARFRREFAVAAAVDHPSLARAFTSGEDADAGRLWFTMRYVDGVDVAARAASLDLRDPERRRRLARRGAEVADALASLHSVGVVHRDVKPGNIRVERRPDAPDGEIAVLVDLGLARTASDHGATSTVLGTDGFVAPERLRGGSGGPAADVYGLGVALYDLFGGFTPSRRPRDEATGELRPLSRCAVGVDDALSAVVECATREDPLERTASAAALRDDLRSWLDGRPVVARSASRTERLLRSIARRPRAAARRALGFVVAATVLCAAVAGGRTVLVGVGDRRTADEALRFGRLFDAVAAAARVPAFLRGGLPEALRPPIAGEPRAVAVVREVLDALATQGPASARLKAAAELEARGFSAAPPLLAFLAAESEAAADLPRRVAALRLLARLLFERPATADADRVAVADLRRALLACAQDDRRDPEERLGAVSALGGCGELEDAPTLIDVGRRLRGPAPEVSLEAVRLALRGAACVVRRAAHRGERLDGSDASRLLDAGAACLADQPAVDVATRRRTAAAAEDLFMALGAHARDGASLAGLRSEVARIFGSDWPHLVFLRAELRDPAMGTVLRSWSPAETEALEPTIASLGRLAGAMAEDVLTADARARAAHLAADSSRGVDRETALKTFDEAAAEARARPFGGGLAGVPDDATRLRRASDDGAAFVDVPFRDGATTADAAAFARWSFDESDGPRRSGGAGAVSVRRGAFTPRRVGDPGRLRLAPLPHAAAEFRFVAAGADLSTARVRVAAQKGSRARLPYEGRASMRVFLDGQEVFATAVTKPEGTVAEMKFLAVGVVAGGERRLVVEGGPDNDTTLWIESVEILR